MDEESEEYGQLLKSCHKRSAEKILAGCLKNGGLYVKLGQGNAQSIKSTCNFEFISMIMNDCLSECLG